MHRKIVAVWVSLIIIISSIVILIEISPRVTAPTTLYVGSGGGGNYTKIQWAIDNASNGDTVFVYNGTYYENVVVNKTINLVGEDRDTTIINGSWFGDTVNVTFNFVNITGFTITGSGTAGSYPNYDAGLEFYYVQYCEIFNNNFRDNKLGISITYSNDIEIKNNNASNNRYGIFLDSSNNINITDNIANRNGQVGIYLYNSSNNNLNNNIASYNSVSGIYTYLSNNIMIKKCVSNHNFGISGHGILVTSSSYNTIEQCEFLSNDANGIHARYALTNNTIIKNNIVSSNDGNAIVLSQTTQDNIIMGNKISKNGYDGITISQTSLNTVENNRIFLNNRHGIHIVNSDWNNIKNNTCHSIKEYGIRLVTSNNNKIYHNNFINNTNQAYDDQSSNIWDDGYPSGGNFWSDYGGVDLNSTINQNIPPPDGIGDTPYIIDSNSQDNYPLMNSSEIYSVLLQGWNLISIPLIQEHKSIHKVLEELEGYYDAVQWYDIADLSKSWKHNKLGKPFGNDLYELNETMGFWIHINQSGDTIFLYNGTTPLINQTIQLRIGWNMVGYPSLSSYNRTDGLNGLDFGTEIDCIQWYDASTQTWHFIDENDSFVPGRGYWVHSKVDTGWEVPL